MMPIDRIIGERKWSDEKHLCPDCERIFVEDGGCDTTTQDLHPCRYAYDDGVEKEDNGMVYWVTKCPKYVKMNTKKLYSDWIKSDSWKEIATKVKQKAGYQCQLCGSAFNLSVHHTTYENLCREKDHMEDLICVCRNCHEKIHKHDLQQEGKNDGFE